MELQKGGIPTTLAASEGAKFEQCMTHERRRRREDLKVCHHLTTSNDVVFLKQANPLTSTRRVRATCKSNHEPLAR